MDRYKKFLIEIKTYLLRDGPGWTTHFSIYEDRKDSIEPLELVPMGNRSPTQAEAITVGLEDAKKRIDTWVS